MSREYSIPMYEIHIGNSGYQNFFVITKSAHFHEYLMVDGTHYDSDSSACRHPPYLPCAATKLQSDGNPKAVHIQSIVLFSNPVWVRRPIDDRSYEFCLPFKIQRLRKLSHTYAFNFGSCLRTMPKSCQHLLEKLWLWWI